LCGEVIEQQETLKALGHSQVIDPAVEPTCSKTGLTEGAHCSVCNEVIVAQNIVPSNKHNFATPIITPPTLEKDGQIEHICSLCGYSDVKPIKTSNFSIESSNRGKIGYTGAENESLVIPAVFEEDGKWYKVVGIKDGAFTNCENLTSVTIPDGVTSIGEYAFAVCNSLTSITIGNGVKHIGPYAFGGCSSLTSITIPDKVTYIGDAAFYGCSSLTSITIPDNVTYIRYGAFYGCSSLTSITIGNGVRSIGDEAFVECSSLTNITIPDSVTNIGNSAFSYCDGLVSITVSDGNVVYEAKGNCLIEKSSKTLIAGCKSSIIPTDGSVEIISVHAFYGCSSLTNIIIPDSVTNIGNSAFYGCSSLTNIIIPDSVTNIGNSAFYGCSSLTSITIGNGVTSIGTTAFSYCDGLVSITVSDGNAVYEAKGNSLIEKSSKTLIAGCKSSIIPADGSVEIIGQDAFMGCGSLTSITIPDRITCIDWKAFLDCSSLTSVYITDLAAWCNINFIDSTSNPLNYAHNLYLNGDLITELVIPDSVTSIDNNAFSGCTSLTSVTIPDSVRYIDMAAFSGCTSLTSVYITDLAAWCNINFGGYLSATSNPLYYAHNLYLNGNLITELVIPDSVKSIGEEAFASCTSLTSVTISDSVREIYSSAFEGCTSLTSVTIGDSVRRIYNSAFEGCTSLTSITFEGTVEQWKAIDFSSDWNHSVPATEVICSDGVVTLN